MMRNGELSGLGRLVWLTGALLIGFASQWCINYGICAVPM
jgi:hypothetical protein